MKTTTKYCQYCYKEFVATRSDAKFCDPLCKQNAYNERIKIKQEQLEADAQQAQAEKSAQLKELTKKMEELKQVREAQENQAISETHQLMNETFKKYESEAIEEKIDKANKILKGWLQQLLEFDQQDGASVHKVKSLFEAIIRSGSYTFYDLPNDYKYLSFINNRLIPKVKNWYDVIRYSREQYIDLGLPKEAKREFTDKIYELG